MASTLFTQRVRGTSGTRLDLMLPAGWPETATTITWRRRSPGGDIQIGTGSLDAIPDIHSATIYVWTSASETLLTHAELPTRSREKLMQALPYALEEQLLDDPANLHFAWRREQDGVLSVAVTNKEQLGKWLATLKQSALNPRALSPATLCIPWSPGSWSAAFIGTEMLVRSGPASGFTCAPATEPPAVLVANLKEAQEHGRAPEYFIVFEPPVEFSPDTWSEKLGMPVRIETQSFWHVPGDSEPALNLLQGEFAAVGEFRQQLRPWLPAAIMLAVWLVGTIAFDLVEWTRLHRQHSQHVREMDDLLLTAFPDTKAIQDPLLQMQKGIDQLQARSGMRTNDLLPLLIRTAPVWQTQTRVKLRGLHYVDRGLTMDITVPDAQALDQFKQALQNNGLRADVLSNTTKDNNIDGQLRIQSADTGGTPS